jgi:hypothetical protein
MSEDPLRLTEMSDPPPELLALVRRMEGPPPLPPELPGLLAPRPRLRIVGPTLAMVSIAVGAYVVYQLVDAPPEPIAPAIELVDAPAPAPPPPPAEPVVAAAIVEPPPPLEPPPVLEPPPPLEVRPRPRPAPPAPAQVIHRDLVRPFTPEVTEAAEMVETDTRPSGLLRLQTTPWAHVFVDGRDTGRTTPTQLRVPAGRHTIGLRTADGVMNTVVVTVGPGETQRIARQLGDVPRSRPREPTLSPFLPPPEIPRGGGSLPAPHDPF